MYKITTLSPGRSFLVCNSHLERNIIFCSEGFVHMFGFTKAEVLSNRTAKGTCDFLKVSLVTVSH
jgi:hypothetical protein